MQSSTQDYPECPLPILLHLSNLRIIIKGKKSTLAQYYKLETFVTFHQFSINVLYLFQDPIQDLTFNLVAMCPWSPLICDDSSGFSFMT